MDPENFRFANWPAGWQWKVGGVMLSKPPGQELVAFGSDFMGRCMAVRSAVIMPNEDGDVSFGLSSEPESVWAVWIQGEDKNFRIVDPEALPESDPLETARLHGFGKRVAEIQAERLATSAAAPEKKGMGKQRL